MFLLRRVASYLCLTLLVLVPAAAAGGPSSVDPGIAADLVPRIHLGEAPKGNPLRNAPLETWLPTLLAGGSLQEAQEAAARALGTDYTVYPLGDLDKDGASDYLLDTVEWLEPTVQEEDGMIIMQFGETRGQSVLAAVSGATHEVLWKMALGPEEYWYTMGDLDGDGIEDLLVERDFDMTMMLDYQDAVVGGVATEEFGYTATAELFAGATGAKLFSRAVGFDLRITIVYAGAQVVFADVLRVEVDASGLWPASAGGGAAYIVEKFTEVAGMVAAYPVAFAGAGGYSSVVQLQRLDASGRVVWEKEVSSTHEPTWLMDEGDYTADGVSDYVVGVSTMPPVFVGADVPVPVPERLKVRLIDGKDGSTEWEHTSAPFMGSWGVLPGGDVRGAGPELILNMFGSEVGDAFQSLGVRLVFLNGKTGTVAAERRWEDSDGVGVVFADVDGKAGDEFILLRAGVSGSFAAGIEYDDTFSLAAVRSDFTEVWKFEEAPDVYVPLYFFSLPRDLPDFQGDGVPDLPAVYMGEEDLELMIRSGADANELWRLAVTSDLVSLYWVDDLDGDGGVELVSTLFDVPDEEEPSASMDEGPQPVPEMEEEEENLTDYPGLVEARSGADLALRWNRTIHDPMGEPNVTAAWAFVQSAGGGDVNADGVADVLYSISSPWCDYGGVMMISPDMDMGCDQGGKEHLGFALVLDGTDGSTIKAYPREPRRYEPPPPEPANDTLPVPLEVPEKGGFLPGPDLGLAAAAAFAVAWARRRR